MSKPKFTPGPWGYVEPPARGELPLVMPNGHRYSVTLTARVGKYTETFGELYSVCCGDADAPFFRERTRANAALIAAAPEMYALLERILEDVHWDRIAVTDRASTFCAIAQLLAKARGEKPKP